jgi:translation initiation factor IF-3
LKYKTDTQLINEEIRAFKMRVISENGENLGILSRDEALNLAQQSDMDLVLLSDKDDIPLVKIMNFGKSQYAKKKKLAESKKKQKTVKVKEIKMRPKIGFHDYMTKINQGVGFLQQGHKLKLTLVFSGREIDGMRTVGSDFFHQVDQSLAQKGVVDLAFDQDAASGRFWSRIYYIKAKK